MTLLLPVVCLFACFLNLLFEHQNLSSLATKAKLLASLAFVGFAWEMGAMKSTYGYVLFIGLIFSLMGDLLLTIQSRKQWFLVGIAAFLLAHICYVLAFFQLGIDTKMLPLILPVVSIALIMTGLWLHKHLSGVFAFAVPAYLFAIGLMLVFAWSNQSITVWWWVVTGASLFAVSDLFVARNRFIKTTIVNRMVGLPMYYIAQLLLAYSIVLV